MFITIAGIFVNVLDVCTYVYFELFSFADFFTF